MSEQLRDTDIRLHVGLDAQNVPISLQWEASDSPHKGKKDCKAFMLSIWDVNESAALRIDLWTKKMMVDDMNDFFFQTFMTMADTYERATTHKHIAEDIRVFSKSFKKKMEEEMKKNQL